MLRSALADSVPLVASGAKVVRRGRDWALLVMGGYPRYGNSGDETVVGRHLSALYHARLEANGNWRLTAQLAPEEQVRLISHRLDVSLDPGVGLTATDAIQLSIRDTNGIVLRLNRNAAISSVTVGGIVRRHEFRGGLLWVDAPRQGTVTAVVRYALAVAPDSTGDPNSGRFLPAAGHLRSQYYWHPFLWFDDAADFQVAVRAPGRVQVATDLPQQVTLGGSTRHVTARTTAPTAALSLFYDAEWRPVTHRTGDFTLTVFATPDFLPTPDSLAAAFSRTVATLRSRFGSPQGGYRSIVQQRARPVGSAGWPYMSNAVIAANWNGGPLMVGMPQPRAFFGHEVAHAWTRPAGPGRNFLSEGWATFAEATLLRAALGDSTANRFWQMQRARYQNGGYEGRLSLLEDDSNSGVSYSKGAWLLRMLEQEIGTAAFDAGFRQYGAGGAGGVTEFVEAMSQAAGRPVAAFIAPWLTSRETPEIEARVEGRRIVVTQRQEPLFPLTVELGLVAQAETTFVAVPMNARQVEVPLPATVPADAGVVVDPATRLLLRGPRGARAGG